jgi:hypothetical protein
LIGDGLAGGFLLVECGQVRGMRALALVDEEAARLRQKVVRGAAGIGFDGHVVDSFCCMRAAR